MPRRVLRAHEPGDENHGNFKVYDPASDGSPGPGAGPVTTTWLPESFKWFGDKNRRALSGRISFFTIGKDGGLHLSKAATEILNPPEGSKVAIGINKKFIALKISDDGFTFFRGKGGSINISARAFARLLAEEGWPLPCRVMLTWDEKSKMLVGKKPGEEVTQATQAS
ncbi:MAG: hypothetical protein AB1523_00170 [Bacillota bacterium]